MNIESLNKAMESIAEAFSLLNKKLRDLQMHFERCLILSMTKMKNRMVLRQRHTD
jgi:hypothetical protein